MANNSTVKKLLQVSEEAAPVLHMPIVVGNELFVLTQQDIRRVEDIRLLSYNRLNSNGQLCPLTSAPASGFGDNSWAAAQPASTPFCTFQDLLKQSQCQRRKRNEDEIENRDERAANVASVATQLNWSKCCQTSFPLKYNAATSTSGLCQSSHVGCQSKRAQCSDCCQTQTCQLCAATSVPSFAKLPKPRSQCSQRSQGTNVPTFKRLGLRKNSNSRHCKEENSRESQRTSSWEHMEETRECRPPTEQRKNNWRIVENNKHWQPPPLDEREEYQQSRPRQRYRKPKPGPLCVRNPTYEEEEEPLQSEYQADQFRQR